MESRVGHHWRQAARWVIAVAALGLSRPTGGGQGEWQYEDRTTSFNRLRIYQVMVEAFADGDEARGYGSGWGPSHHRGDLRGIIEALPYIADLGANAIWLTPIFDSDRHAESEDRLDATGYYARDYFRIDPEFGTLEDARVLVDRAHELELYVFLDGVFGHHKGDVPRSPQGRAPVGSSGAVEYPASLEFYSEVATLWA